MELSFAEGRVLSCLVEKQLLTPQAYPLTDNALVAACNQTTSRDPVVQYDVATVRLAVRSLREAGLLRTTHRTGERSDKHEHRLPEVLGLSPAEVALLAVLLLRGAQTPGELRARTERMHAFGSVAEVEQVLDTLADRDEPLVSRLGRRPGHKEDRYADALVPRDAAPDVPREAAHAYTGTAPPAGAVPAWPARDVAVRDVATQDIAALRAEVAELRGEVAELRAALASLDAAPPVTASPVTAPADPAPPGPVPDQPWHPDWSRQES